MSIKQINVYDEDHASTNDEGVNEGCSMCQTFEQGKLRYRALNYESICIELQVPTIDVVMRTARLKFLQNIVRNKKHHTLFWCAVLGHYEIEEEPSTNPWAEQFACDVLALSSLDGTSHLVETVSVAYHKKMPGPECAPK